MASEIRVNKITNRSGLSTATWNDDGIDVAGIATAHNFKTGTTNVHSTGVELANVNTGGATATFGCPLVGSTGSFSSNVTISGNLGVAGTVTYEDVARVDATGISTFREGFGVGPLAGIAATHYADGSIRTTGIITANTYYGSGANLTGIDATQIVTGNTSVQTVDTGSDGHVKINTEGSERVRVGAAGSVGIGTDDPYSPLSIYGDTSPGTFINITSRTNTIAGIKFGDFDDPEIGAIKYGNGDNSLRFFANGSSEKFRVGSAGQWGIGGSNYGTSGQVLTSGGASAAPAWAAAGGGKLKGWAIGTSWYGTTGGATSSNKIDLFSQAYTPTDANSNILIFVPIEIDARTSSYSDRIRIEGMWGSTAQHARWLIHGSFGNSSGSIFTLPYIYKPTGWSAGSSTTFKVRLWSEGSSGSPSDQYNVRVHESSYYLLAEFGP